MKKRYTVPGAHRKTLLTYIVPVLVFTFLLFLPALRNGFTNWDDILYVTGNPLLKDLSLDGLKAIFSTPVVSNYHPFTILSLALNYQFAELEPWSYHLTSILLHVVNTGLVFWFILLLSGRNLIVSAAVALLFGIHPMHVESVAWISERKDLLYSVFYLGAMITYLYYIMNRKLKQLILVSVFGAISLLCKPAAIILPLTLLLLDYYTKRKWDSALIIEKIPLFVFSAIMAYVTFTIQSDRAVASVEFHSVFERFCFAGFGLIWYLIKFIFPYPLSGLHPFPDQLNILYYGATFLSLASIGFLIWKVRNRNVLFAFGFYLVNLILVLQIISVGNAVVAERYTYVPYISLAFLLCITGYELLKNKWKEIQKIVLALFVGWILFLSYITFTRIPVWKNSETFWNDVLKHYPDNPRAWTNRALYYYDQKDWPRAINDLTDALKHNRSFANALEWRAKAYLEVGQGEKARADAEAFYQLYPKKPDAMAVLARSYDATNRKEEALKLYNHLIPIVPHIPEYINNRGVIFFNTLRKYPEARLDFERAISIDPNNGLYYLNLSRCFYMMSDNEKAKENAQKAKQLGQVIASDYSQMIGLE